MARVHRPLTLILLALAVAAATHPTPARAARQASEPIVDALVARKGRDVIGLRGHGFVRDSGGDFTAIDVPGAREYTITFGLDEDGRAVGAYVDRRGRTHGFVRDRSGDFTTVDFPRAGLTFATRVNNRGQIVGLYAEDPNAPAQQAPHGFLLDHGRFTKIDVPGATATQPFGINDHGQIVGAFLDDAGIHGFLLDNGTFTTFDAPGSTTTVANDIDDSGRIAGYAIDATGTHGFLRNTSGAITFVDVPNTGLPLPGRPDPPQTAIFGLNNQGQMVGYFEDATGIHGFLLDQGTFTTIEVPEAASPSSATIVFDINDAGQLAGGYELTGYGYLRDRRGNFSTISHPDAVQETIALGINNRGDIVGAYFDATGTVRGFLRGKEGFTTIDVPGALGSGAIKINDHRQIVGSYSTLTNRNHPFPTHGYLFDRGVFTTIDVPGAQHTQPTDIDNQGLIVGEYLDAAGTLHGFLRDPGGAFTTFDIPGATVTSIASINERGQMVGGYTDAAGISHGFLHEPSGELTTIDVAGATVTLPLGISNRGQVVGLYIDGIGPHGFLWSNGRFRTISAPGTFQFSNPWDIDDRGRMVGFY
jgi:uncharacterized membrane protein